MFIKLAVEKMPSNCGECPLYVCYRRWSGDPGDEFCGFTKDDVNALQKTRPAFCPLKWSDAFEHGCDAP